MAEHSTANTPAPELDRAFVRIAEGLVHYRHGGELSDAAPYPVFYAHPGSKASAYAPLILREVAGSLHPTGWAAGIPRRRRKPRRTSNITPIAACALWMR
jgi:hypothetical protein